MALATGASLRYSDDLVDLRVGHISREIFVNDEIYHQEQEQVFARCWLFVGHESQVSKPGDYFVSCMGEESVILCRDRLGEIHVFLNSCRHRGMKVCRYDEGNTPVFTCPYHGWSYATDGKLVGVPYFKDAYHEKLDKSKWGLVEVAQLENYKPTFPIWLKSCLSNSSMVFQPLSNYGPFLRVPSYNNSMICHFAVRCRKHHGGT